MSYFILFLSLFITQSHSNNSGFYELAAHNLAGATVPLKTYEGKVLLIVNTASQCGYTPQYAGLQKLYQEYHSAGFEILAFPSNDFGGQEPGNAREIKKFCETRYHVSFPLFEKAPVSGKSKQAVYQWLLKQKLPNSGNEVAWNFEKFLISKKGAVVARFLSNIDPESDAIKKAIDEELKK